MRTHHRLGWLPGSTPQFSYVIFGEGGAKYQACQASGWKVAKGGRTSSRLSPWNLALNCSRTTFVAGQ